MMSGLDFYLLAALHKSCAEHYRLGLLQRIRLPKLMSLHSNELTIVSVFSWYIMTHNSQNVLEFIAV